MSRKFGGSVGGGKGGPGGGLKFQRPEPSFIQKIKAQVGYKDTEASLQDKVKVTNILSRGHQKTALLIPGREGRPGRLGVPARGGRREAPGRRAQSR